MNKVFSSILTRLSKKQDFVEEAKKAGVQMGRANDVASPFWEAAEPYLITIGNNNQITNGVKIYTHGGTHVARFLYPNFDCFGKVTIGDWCYIGNNVLIMPGVSIGDHVLIAAGSVVTHSYGDNVVIGGNPARIICSLDEYLEKNSNYNVNSKGLSPDQKKELLLGLPDERFITK